MPLPKEEQVRESSQAYAMRFYNTFVQSAENTESKSLTYND